jgi:hypothetical protein
MKIRHLAASLTACAVLTSQSLRAASHDPEMESLHTQLQALAVRLDRLEASNRELREENARLRESGARTAAAVARVGETTEAAVQRVAAASEVESWSERIGIKGDFRYRYENIDETGRDERNRNRVRARAAVIADVTDHLQAGIGMASGGSDPVSTNQTLGGGGSTKDLRLDLAYFQWTGLDDTRVLGGKFKNFLYKPGKHALLWDGDWNPEGLGLAWDNGAYFANLLGTWIESDSNRESEFSYGLQAGFRKDLGDKARLSAGISYFDIGTAGKGTFYGDDDDFFGNSFDPATNTYLYDYGLLELFADLAFEVGQHPASVFVDYVRNQDAPQFDTGYALGFKYGSARAGGTWAFGYAWQDLEADAVFGLFTDSDFGGGGTDVRGHILKGSYAIEKNWNADFTYFLNEIDGNAGNKHDYDRLQVDLVVKY